MNTINTENKAADHIPEENRPQSSKWIKVGDLQPFPPIAKALPPKPEMVASIAEVMRTVGYDGSQPITTWRDQVVDGNTRLAAAKEAGLAKVPCVEMSFNSEDDALFSAISRQVQRRNLSDAELARLFELIDKPIPRGGPPDRGSAKAIAGKQAIARSADATAEKLGTSREKVENLRMILRRSPEIFNMIKERDVTIKEAKAKLSKPKKRASQASALAGNTSPPADSYKRQRQEYQSAGYPAVHAYLKQAYTACKHDPELAGLIDLLIPLSQVAEPCETEATDVGLIEPEYQ